MSEPWKPAVNEIDQRVVKTREGIRAAFERLLETMPYNDITVSAIAREARISRRTFYVHYGTVEELLRQSARERVELATDALQPAGELRDVGDLVRELTRTVLEMLRDDPNLAGNVVKSLSTAQLLDLAREPLADVCRIELRKRGMREVEALEDWLAFYLGGLFAVYGEWEHSGRDQKALDDAAALIGEVTANGIVGML
ncbi:MAG: TetR/AcrR family transcriptional regulator [Eggerthellaceae bacterium]|nr:TetR/AcrR family transcriptional regulator [Eggerthellaceae bacterium]